MAERNRPKRPPARTREGREEEMVGKAIDLAEQQLEDGTASAQVITHYLKLGTVREQLEREKISHENTLLQARAEQIQNQEKMDVLFREAMQAFGGYSGQPRLEEDDYDED